MFPTLKNVNQVFDAIRDRDEFICADKGDYLVFNYLVSFEDTFPTADTKDSELNEKYLIRRECRGLIWLKNEGRFVRRYHKFFNVNERPETDYRKIDLSKPYVILDKLDGSMITPLLVNGELRYGTKMGITDIAAPVEKFVQDKKGYRALWDYLFNTLDMSPIYEWCSRRQRIVIDYPEDMLVLTAVRHNVTGDYMTYDDLVTLSKDFGVPVVKAYNGLGDNVAEILSNVRDMSGIEGFIIRFDDGSMYKIKCQEYMDLHKAVSSLAQEKDVIRMILDNKSDDLKAALADDMRDRIVEFENKLITEIEKTAERLKWEVIAAKDNYGKSKKDFAIKVVNNPKNGFTSDEKGLLFKIYDGADPLKTVLEFVKAHTNTGPRVDSIRYLIGNVRWEF